MEILPIISLISVGTVVIITLILGFVVFFSNRKSITNRTFLFFSSTTTIWSILNYLSYQFNSPDLILWILRLVMFSAVWYSFGIFTLFYVSPYEKINFPKWYKFIVLPLVIFISFFTLTPAVFRGIKILAPAGQISVMDVGPGIVIFGLSVIGLILSGFIILIKKILNKKGMEKKQLLFLLIGASLFVVFVLIFNFILPAFFDNPYFIALSALFTFPFIALTSYAILKHRLFNVKVIATELLVFAIWIIILIELLLAEGVRERILSGVVLLFTIISGIFLIKSVIKEVRAREEVEELAAKLESANLRLKQLDEAKSDFVSIASHQLRTPLTAIKGYASMILEGNYGKISEATKGAVDKIFRSSQQLVLIIGDFLDISHIEQGTMQYDFAPLDVKELASGLANEFKTTIGNSTDKSKALEISFEADEKENFIVSADRNKIRQAVSNLIDNSIKYTPSGFVKIQLSKISENGNVLIKIEDSGIGISSETISNLFKKFGRAKGFSSMYANGSGLGLYVAKEIIKAHKGKIWVESEGEGKGSRFFMELPVR